MRIDEKLEKLTAKWKWIEMWKDGKIKRNGDVAMNAYVRTTSQTSHFSESVRTRRRPNWAFVTCLRSFARLLQYFLFNKQHTMRYTVFKFNDFPFVVSVERATWSHLNLYQTFKLSNCLSFGIRLFMHVWYDCELFHDFLFFFHLSDVI